MDSEWKCPHGHSIEMVNEGYGICFHQQGRVWSAWSFNGDNMGGYRRGAWPFGDFPLAGMKAWVRDVNGDGTREEAIEFIRSRRPQSTLVALPTQEELALR